MRYILLFLFCINLNAQLSIAGTEYVLLGDLETQYNTHRTESERFPDVIWDQGDQENLNSMVRAFVRDATTHGADLDLSNTRHNLRLRPPTYWDDPRIGGTSYYSTRPGYDINININVWNDLNGIQKIQLVYHELGHGLLHAGHICDRTTIGNRSHYAVMSTATCLVENGGPGLSVSEYNLSLITEWIDHLFNPKNIIPIPGQAAKGPGIIHCY